jgi:hypothetical protein
LGLPDDAVHGDVLEDEVAQGLGAFGGYVEVEVVAQRKQEHPNYAVARKRRETVSTAAQTARAGI